MPARTALWMLACAAALVSVATGTLALQTSPDVDGSATQAPAQEALTNVIDPIHAAVEPTHAVVEPAHTAVSDPASAGVVPDLGDPAPLVGDGTGFVTDLAPAVPVDIDTGVGVTAHVSTSVGTTPGADAPAPASTSSRDASLPATVWNVVPDDAAGRSIFAGALLGAIALAVEASRFLSARLGAPIGRALRALVAIVPAFALFSRIERGSLLENPVRARVHDAIAQDPGMSLSEVSARAGIAWGTTVHHLRRLEAHGMVVSIDQPPHRRFFTANSPAALQRTAVAGILQPTARRIAELVHARPGIDQTGVCQTLGLRNPSASKHLRAFETQGLVESAREGRSRHYHATAALGSALAIVSASSMAVGSRQRHMTAITPISSMHSSSGLRPAMTAGTTGA